MLSPLAARYSIINHLETNIAYSGDQKLADGQLSWRRESGNNWERLAARTIDSYTVSHPRIFARLIRRQLPADMQYVGAGHHTIAYRSGETIRKVYKRTIQLDEPSRLELAASEQKKHLIMKQYLGEVALDQTVVVAPHPLVTKKRVVQIVQPYCPFEPLDELFPGISQTIDDAALENILSSYPQLGMSFYNFAEASLRMAADTQYVPDLTGRHNIGLTIQTEEPQLRLVDSLPTDLSSSFAVDYILPQLTHLKQRLS